MLKYKIRLTSLSMLYGSATEDSSAKIPDLIFYI